MHVRRKVPVREVSHRWMVKSESFPLFSEGKDLEVRVKNGFPERVRAGESLFINRRLWRRVIAVRPYPNFDAMLVWEDYRRVHPKAESEAEVLAALRELYPANLERKGVLVFELVTT